jgi:hypothetical protein
MQSVGQSLLSRAHFADVVRGQHLAQDLMIEILSNAYVDATSPVFGHETGESSTDRTQFDDVDDYHGLDGSPPKKRSGTEIPGFTGWRRQATVQWVTPSNPNSVSMVDLGLKRITVTVSRNGATVAQISALRSALE